MHHKTAGKIVHPRDERHVNFAAPHALNRRSRQRAAQFNLDARKRFLEHRKHRGQHVSRVEIGNAEDDMALNFRRREPREQFVM